MQVHSSKRTLTFITLDHQVVEKASSVLLSVGLESYSKLVDVVPPTSIKVTTSKIRDIESLCLPPRILVVCCG